MWLQCPGGVYWWENDCSIYGVRTPSSYSRLDGVDTFAYCRGPQQLLSLSFGVVLFVRWTSVNVAYNSLGGGWGSGGSRVVILGSVSSSSI